MNPSFFKQSDLVTDYLNEKEHLLTLYGQPLNPDWQLLSNKIYSSFKNREIYNILFEQNKKNPDPSVQENLKKLKNEKCLFIVTGQQLGLFVSPLYIIYKILHTLKMADKLNRENSDFSILPVFWLEGEDHDYKEVSHFSVLDKNNNLKKYNLKEPQSEQQYSINNRNFTEEISELLNTLKGALQESEFQEELFEKLKLIYTPGENWLNAFEQHICHLLEGSGLLLFNPGAREVKALSKSFFKEAVRQNDILSEKLQKQTELVKAAKYKAQVPFLNDRAYLFYKEDGKKRLSIIKQNDSYYIRETEKSFSKNELIDHIENNEEIISTTVLTRPLLQSFLLPVISYVAGPAEVAYWAQLKQAFSLFNLEMPHVQPRQSVTVLEPRTLRILNKLDIDLNHIDPDPEKFIEKYLKEHNLDQLTLINDDLKNTLDKNEQELQKLIKKVDPTLSSPLKKTFQSIYHNFQNLEKRIIKHSKNNNETTINQIRSVFNSTLPNKTLQERIISSIYFCNKYGTGWIKKVYEKIDLNPSQHIFVEL